ncbi:ABC transporter ATP-binding protein [Rhodococcus sp. CX]|uniref:ABC transporter ATP-binding protein n=1 Tax=Rhodococcus sp. CX TaxID=2789880 RepID=UPI0018CD4EBF|nr:ABC transporter ATP-binding protein [Rhodococcus sp. CX]MBH0119030.1 ABC transporter ATP-binding protein [Rhodococcus sp. CX]
MSALLDIASLSVAFDGKPAITDVTLQVAAGDSVALVGGSGAGKSTVARAVAGLVTPTAGRIVFDGVDLTAVPQRRRRAARKGMHLVFQDPYASLPPTLRVGDIVAEPMVIHRIGDRDSRRQAAVAALESVHLRPAESFLQRYPHELSGGQRQRVAFARALVTRPKLLLADEPTSGLDASLRLEIVDLMGELAVSENMAVVHITHDLALAARSCRDIVVMQGGRIVEAGRADTVLADPAHEYTAALVGAVSGV